MTESLRERLIDCAGEINRLGLSRGTSGNLSARQGDGMLITPSALPYRETTTGDIVFVDLDTGTPDPGSRRPSSEWRIHRDVYRACPHARAIVHAHPIHATTLACLRRDMPAFHYMVAVAGGHDIRCAPYATFGTQALSDHVVAALEGRRACLMANHGVLCLGADPNAALVLCREIEALAEMYLLCLSAGEPALLDEAEMDRVLEKFRDYGSWGPPR